MWTQINSLPAFSSPQTRRAISSAQIRWPRLRMSNSIIWYAGSGAYARLDGSTQVYIISADTADAMRYATYASMSTDALLPLDMERVSGFAVAISGETTKIAVTESAATADEAGEEPDAESAAAKVYTVGDTTLDSEKVHSMR